MKTCPHCNTSCDDNDIVCANCGYLFAAGGFPKPPEDAGSDYQPAAPRPYHPEPKPEEPKSEPFEPAEPKADAPQSGPAAEPYRFENPPFSAKTSGLSIAGMVLGIIGVVLGCCYGIGLLASIPGLILSIVALRKISRTGERGRGQAIAGIICSSVGILLAVYMIVALISAVSSGAMSSIWQTVYQQMQNSGAATK